MLCLNCGKSLGSKVGYCDECAKTLQVPSASEEQARIESEREARRERQRAEDGTESEESIYEPVDDRDEFEITPYPAGGALRLLAAILDSFIVQALVQLALYATVSSSLVLGWWGLNGIYSTKELQEKITAGIISKMGIASSGESPDSFLMMLIIAGGIGFLAAVLFPLLVSLLYHPLFECSRWQATPAKKILGIKVTDMSFRRIGFIRSCGRNLARNIYLVPLTLFFLSFKIFPSATVMLGLVTTIVAIGTYAIIPFTERRQGLHDLAARCEVIGPTTINRPRLFLVLALDLALIFGSIYLGIKDARKGDTYSRSYRKHYGKSF